MSTKNERTKRIQVRLSDSMFERLQKLSKDMGIPYSTLSTVAVSEYVIRKEREGYIASASVDAMKETIEEQVSRFPEIITQYEKTIDLEK